MASLAGLRYDAPVNKIRNDRLTYYTYVDSPLQQLLLTSDGESLTGLYMVKQRYGPEVGDGWIQQTNATPFAQTEEQLQSYFKGERTEFDLPLALRGTVFQNRVWAELRAIAFGTTISYGELARRIGSPNGSRAVGLANGHNPISIIVPCHRVIGTNGKLVGYGGGLSRKEALLAFESSVLTNKLSLFPFSSPEYAWW